MAFATTGALVALPVIADPIPISAFARMPAIRNVVISPDGRFFAMIQSEGDKSAVTTLDLQSKEASRVVLGEDKDGRYRLSWCNWGNNTRLVCGYRAVVRKGAIYAQTRLVAVNADGTGTKLLMQDRFVAGTQLQDGVVDWTYDDPNTILVEGDEDVDAFPEVYELNIYDGKMKVRVLDREPIRGFVSDRKGNVRLGYGRVGTQVSYYARNVGATDWTRLEKFTVFSEGNRLTPIAITTDPSKVYAIGNHEGRDALWEMDLSDRANPVLIASHPEVDVDNAILNTDGRLMGVYYDTDRPVAFYTDPVWRGVSDSINKIFPSTSFSEIYDQSKDENLFVIRSGSDVDSGGYYLLNRAQNRLSSIGKAYPELEPYKAQFGKMQSINYKARDGVVIPGYLILPPGSEQKSLPLIVMPHGGPIARDTWGFGWLEQFLVSRGYAVLQMNFRGSSGYGKDWQHAAHQDWGGLTYDDITDGAKWAIKEGIADPKRMCIVGWSFGGYAALLGATRNSDLYKCSVSIAGVSDLIDLENDQRAFVGGGEIARKQIGTGHEKLVADSPRRHPDGVAIPVLLIHGEMDMTVRYEHSAEMASALKNAKKAYKLVKIPAADHSMSRESERVTLLSELEVFLKTHLGSDNVSGSATR
jgi:dipeptidyl aminopeptidase/acylaminoacyl peptidase